MGRYHIGEPRGAELVAHLVRVRIGVRVRVRVRAVALIPTLTVTLTSRRTCWYSGDPRCSGSSATWC